MPGGNGPLTLTRSPADAASGDEPSSIAAGARRRQEPENDRHGRLHRDARGVQDLERC